MLEGILLLYSILLQIYEARRTVAVNSSQGTQYFPASVFSTSPAVSSVLTSRYLLVFKSRQKTPLIRPVGHLLPDGEGRITRQS
jgi:hypothetical protein